MTNLSRRWRRGFDAAQAALQHAVPPRGSTALRMGAALFCGANLVSIGFNDCSRSHPDTKLKMIHAELMALIRRRHYDDPDNLVMYVYRQSALGKPACSKPCPMCMACMVTAGIRRVRFVDSRGRYAEIKLQTAG